MGRTLKVWPGASVTLRIRLYDPPEENHSPYSFNNPALLQVGIQEPLNKPTVRHVDIITGKVTSPYPPGSAEYRNPLAPPTTELAAKFTADGSNRWHGDGPWKEMTWTLSNVTSNSYVRVRGSNMPAGTPNERDENGNPLRDDLANNIGCTDAACPPHVNGIFDADVEAWGDLWFHGIPIFIEVGGKPRPHGEDQEDVHASGRDDA